MENEKRLIDANALKELVYRRSNNLRDKWTSSAVILAVGAQPTVDAVEVVRCRNCKHYHPQNISGHWEHKKPFCMRTVTVKMNPDDFCSYGERKDNG